MESTTMELDRMRYECDMKIQQMLNQMTDRIALMIRKGFIITTDGDSSSSSRQLPPCATVRSIPQNRCDVYFCEGSEPLGGYFRDGEKTAGDYHREIKAMEIPPHRNPNPDGFHEDSENFVGYHREKEKDGYQKENGDSYWKEDGCSILDCSVTIIDEPQATIPIQKASNEVSPNSFLENMSEVVIDPVISVIELDDSLLEIDSNLDFEQPEYVCELSDRDKGGSVEIVEHAVCLMCFDPGIHEECNENFRGDPTDDEEGFKCPVYDKFGSDSVIFVDKTLLNLESGSMSAIVNGVDCSTVSSELTIEDESVKFVDKHDDLIGMKLITGNEVVNSCGFMVERLPLFRSMGMNRDGSEPYEYFSKEFCVGGNSRLSKGYDELRIDEIGAFKCFDPRIMVNYLGDLKGDRILEGTETNGNCKVERNSEYSDEAKLCCEFVRTALIECTINGNIKRADCAVEKRVLQKEVCNFKLLKISLKVIRTFSNFDCVWLENDQRTDLKYGESVAANVGIQVELEMQYCLARFSVQESLCSGISFWEYSFGYGLKELIVHDYGALQQLTRENVAAIHSGEVFEIDAFYVGVVKKASDFHVAAEGDSLKAMIASTLEAGTDQAYAFRRLQDECSENKFWVELCQFHKRWYIRCCNV